MINDSAPAASRAADCRWTGSEEGRPSVGRVVDGEGVHLILEDGRRLLDGTNTGAPLGHRHPDMVEAMRRAADLPVIHEAWAAVERDAAIADLQKIGFDGAGEWFGGVRFCLSGTEANDMALSLAQAITGRTALATRERSYHGGAGLARVATLQPHWHGGLAWRDGRVQLAPKTVKVVELPGPLGERIGATPAKPDVDRRRLDGAEEALTDVAAVIVDYTQGATYYSAAYQDALAVAASAAGALWIADEVVTGLGRTGTRFAFEGGESRPDLITLGKGLGAGAAPVGAVLVSRSLAERLEGSSWQTSGTFRGHPATIAAVRAYLRVLARDRLIDHVADLDATMHSLLRELAAAHPSVRRIDGRGLHWTIELHGDDWRTWRGATDRTPLGTRVAVRAAEAGALILTSGERSSVFLAPPMISTTEDLKRLMAAVDHGLAVADAEV